MAQAGHSPRPSEQDESTSSEPYEPPNGDITIRLKNLTESAVYQQMKRHFLMTGKGRRPDLPVGLSSTNELLVQLFLLKEEGQASFRTLKSWLEKLVPSTATVTDGRIKRKVTTILASIDQMPPEEWPQFLQKECDFHTLAEPLAALGLNRLHLTKALPYYQTPAQHVSNDVVIALDNFRVRERETLKFVFMWLKSLSTHCATMSDQQLKNKVQLVVKKAQSLSKHKQTNSLTELRKSPFPNIPGPIKESRESNVPASCHECTSKDNIVRKLRGEINKLSNDVKDLHHEVSLKDDILKVDMKQLRESNQQFEQHIKELEGTLKKVKSERDLLHDELENVRTSKLYYKRNFQLNQNLAVLEKENREVLQDLANRKCEIDNLNSALTGLKEKIKSEQSLKSGFRASLLKVQNENSNLKQILNLEEKERTITLREFSSSHRFTDQVRKTFYALQGEANVPASNCAKVVAIVSKHLFQTDLKESDLPKQTSSLNFSNEAHVLAKHHVLEEIKKCDHFIYASDGTSRQKASFLEQHIILSNGAKLSLGFCEVASEDSDTLLEKCIHAFKEIVEINSLDSDGSVSSEEIFKEIIRKLKGLLSDRAAVMKAFDKKMVQYKEELLGGEDVSIHFLFCNAHFLLALSSASEEGIKLVEKVSGEKLGRDANKKFSMFQSSSESATIRLIRTSSELFGPRGDEKSGCRQNWLAFCSLKNKQSMFSSYRSNRFNNLFQNATAVLFHKEDIEEFLKDYNGTENLKLQSVLEDLRDNKILNNLGVLSFFHVFFSEPYWSLMNSNKSYAEFPNYVTKMNEKLLSWINIEAIDSSQELSVFDDFKTVDKYTSVILKFFTSVYFHDISFTACLRTVAQKCHEALNRQLSDFLAEGVFGGEINEEVLTVLKTCPLTNLTGERLFGDFDYCLNTRRNASLFLRSTRNMWKHNKTVKFLNKQTSSMSRKLVKKAIKYGPEFRRKSREMKKAVMEERKARLKEKNQKKNAKDIKFLERKKAALDAVLCRKDGLIVTKREELDKLYESPQALQRLREQIRFRNLIGGEKIKITGNKKILYHRLLQHISSNDN